MSQGITESLLEMHFHAEVVDSFRKVYGAQFIKMLKPSQQDEVWVGFDQGWIRSTMSQNDLVDQISRAVQRGSSTVKNFYFGYFMQYKAVQTCKHKSKYCPSSYTAPYFRSELSLSKNRNTHLSQHSTLRRLARVKNAFVYYVCPMVFTADEVFDIPDLDKLRIVPIDTSPTGWKSKDRHFITFQIQSDPNPIWNSEPLPGKSLTFKEFMDRENRYHPRPMDGGQLLTLIDDSKSTILRVEDDVHNEERDNEPTYYEETREYERENPIPESFTIIEFSNP